MSFLEQLEGFWDPLSLLPLAGALFSHWDHIASPSSAWAYRDYWQWASLRASTEVVARYTLFVTPGILWLFGPSAAAWVARHEVKSRIAIRGLVRRLQACAKGSRMYWFRVRLKLAQWSTSCRWTHGRGSALTEEIHNLRRNLDSHVLRLLRSLSPYERAQSAHRSERTFYESLVVPDQILDDTVALLLHLETAWTSLLGPSQHDLTQVYAYLRRAASMDPPRGDTLPRLGWKREGWGIIRQRTLRRARDEVAKRWQVVDLPEHILGRRLSRMQITAVLILLSLMLRVLRRVLFGTLFGWPIWETLVYCLFKKIQLAPMRIDESVKAGGDHFRAAVTIAIFSDLFRSIDLDVSLFQILNAIAAQRTLQDAREDLHDAILDAVLARNELKQRTRELRDDKREAGSLRRSD